MEKEHDVGGYVSVFVRHLAHTRACLGLWISSPGSEVANSEVGASEGATRSNGDAITEWTPVERDAFFRALSVYSRWRPDLIAACVPKKTEWEVWTYLQALEEGAERLEVDTNADAPCSDVDFSSQSDETEEDTELGKGIRESEVVCEPALEVSQAWIDMEEQMAAWIVHREKQALLGDDEDESAVDDAEVAGAEAPVKRRRSRSRGSGKRRAQSRARERVPGEEHSQPPAPRRRRGTSTSATRRAQDRELLMGHLEMPHLLVLDNILREGEVTANDRGESQEESAVLEETGDGRTAGDGDAQASSLSNRTKAPTKTGSSSNVVIDPFLLALSGDTGAAIQPSECTSGFPQPTSLAIRGSEDVPNNTFDKANAATGAEPDLTLFSPRSRRRIQKRLYMRRKRASFGENVDTGTERLKPGKKAKLELSETHAASTPMPRSEAPSDAEMESTEDAPRKGKGGLTLPYKLKAQFAELGVDAAYLHEQGMDLLNLGALGRLLGIWSSLEHGDEEVDMAQSIDAELIRHLQAATVSFVTDIIYRAIVWREREVRLKQRCQVWRQGEQITTGAIEHAVDVVGARYRSHKDYFRSLETLDTPSSGPGPCKPNVHREVYTPLVCSRKMGPLACLVRTYEGEALRTRRGPSAEPDEDELMSDETDEEALEEDLEEEDAVEVLDAALAESEEASLWESIKVNK